MSFRAAIAGACLALYAATSLARVPEQYAALQAAFVEDLRALANTCETAGERELAAEIAAWAAPPSPYLIVPVFPEQAAQPPSEEVSPAHRQFWELRRRQADALWELARQALAEDLAPLAWQLAWQTLRENPDHEDARRVLGYVRHDAQWLTAYEADKARAGQLWHPRFGWIRADRVARYEQGERLHKGRWITAADDARAHAEIARGWEILTEHYRVTTNHSLEEGVRLAALLERLYHVWHQAFAAYHVNKAALARLFAGARPRASQKRLQVVYFRNREQYVAALAAEQPQIHITTGYYSYARRTAYFFAPSSGDEGDTTTFYHEATHQLFSEIRPTAQAVGTRGNFWAVEGAACYMETLAERDGRWCVGGTDGDRFLAARYRLLEEGFYIPLAELTAMTMQDVQADVRISRLYSQAAGLTHFFMHAQQGRYRQPFVEYLSAIYAGRDQPDTLAQLMGCSNDELDQQYRQFMTAVEE
ncbi:MAG: hypothetical protein K6T86_20295 [Pirellulales bacterium]|nr:hypothetical protein [Pirellulales bacterium]